MSSLAIGIIVVVVIFVLYRATKRPAMVRFYRASDPASSSTSSSWQAYMDRAKRDNRPYDVIDVNLDDDKSENTKKWTAYYKVTKLPTIISVSKWTGQVEVYKGGYTRSEYDKHAIQHGLIKPVAEKPRTAPTVV